LTSQPIEEVRNNFQAALHEHGYAFQVAVTNFVGCLVNQPWSSFRVSAVELPVEVRERATRIDLILSSPSGGRQLICECKRPNPALSNWCFIADPYFSRSGLDSSVRCEQLERDTTVAVARSAIIGHVPTFAHIAFEVRTNKSGDPTGRGRGAIEEAVTQVLTGVSGLAQLYRRDPHLISTGLPTTLVPVVFTTANLWFSRADLSQANIEDGKLDLAASGFERVPWLTLQYAQSLSLRHDLPIREQYRDLEEVRQVLFARSVAVVSPDGIESYLKWCRAA
jgi:hypothetical protein